MSHRRSWESIMPQLSIGFSMHSTPLPSNKFQQLIVMALEGELAGINGIECECGIVLSLQVCHSAAGYYLGYQCNTCGPYSRETGYYPTLDKAKADLKKETPDNLRNTVFVADG